MSKACAVAQTTRGNSLLGCMKRDYEMENFAILHMCIGATCPAAYLPPRRKLKFERGS